MNDEISNSTAIALAAAVTIGILAIFSLLLASGQDSEKRKDHAQIEQEIHAGKCPIRVATPCGEDVCRYTAVVPCAELEALVKRGAHEP